jgi:2-keto-4-pentenoate hydratase
MVNTQDNGRPETRKILGAMDLLMAYDEGSIIDRQKFQPIHLLADAQVIQNNCVAMREVRGEQVVGMKIGFTNRSIWPIYNVNHPIWAPVYRESVFFAPSGNIEVSLKNACQPRIEPEIVLGLKPNVTPASSSIEDVFAALAWVAHGFEIVQSPFEAWKFNAAEAHAAQGLHYKLIVGQQLAIEKLGSNAMAFDAWLAHLKVTLRCGGNAVASGRGSNVLDGPLRALCQLVTELPKHGQTLQAGAIVTTGTLTDAMPIKAGEHWQTEFDLHSLAGLSIRT